MSNMSYNESKKCASKWSPRIWRLVLLLIMCDIAFMGCQHRKVSLDSNNTCDAHEEGMIASKDDNGVDSHINLLTQRVAYNIDDVKIGIPDGVAIMYLPDNLCRLCIRKVGYDPLRASGASFQISPTDLGAELVFSEGITTYVVNPIKKPKEGWEIEWKNTNTYYDSGVGVYRFEGLCHIKAYGNSGVVVLNLKVVAEIWPREEMNDDIMRPYSIDGMANIMQIE